MGKNIILTMLRLSRPHVALCGVLLSACSLGTLAADDDMSRLAYNHPGLVVDLGVGLWAWPLPMDYDGDGDYDLVVSCPDKPYNGTYVFENATGDTAVNPLPVFKAGRRIGKGVSNAQLSYVGGQPRVLTPGQAFPEFRATGFDKGVKLSLPANVHPQRVRANQWRYVDFDGDGRTDVAIGVGDWTDYGWDNAYDANGTWTNGPLHGLVYIARNTGSDAQPAYATPEKLIAGGTPVDVYGMPSPSFADFDGDGDLDLLCGEFLDGFTYFANIGTRTAPRYAEGRRLRTPDGRALTMDLQMITPTAFDWDRDGDPDLICGDEDGRVAFIENTGTPSNDGMPRFLPPRYFRQEAADLKCGALATPWAIDWDGDGDQDILCGNTAGYIEYFENLGKAGEERPRWAAPRRLEAGGRTIRIQAGPNGSIQGPCEAKWGYTTLSATDWDGDGLPDVVANSILGKVHWYRNVGSRHAPKLAAAQPIEIAWGHEGQPALDYGWMRPEGNALLTQWRTTPVAVDWDRDGLVDLVMLDQEGYLALFRREERDGKRVLLPPARVFCDEKGAPLRLNGGKAGRSGRRKLCVADWDGDGRDDILVNSVNADLFRQMEARDGTWRFRNMGAVAERRVSGHSSSPAAVDLNADGIADLLCGAEDGHLYYLHNPRALPGPECVPGVVIDYIPASSGLYVGSPSIAILPDGAYVASHDLFGPKAKADDAPATRVFRSMDRGETWTRACELRGQFWSTLFEHRGALYLMGTCARYNNVVIRRSDDGGRTWTEPTDGTHGLLFEGHYHCAPVPVLEHAGRLWRAMEDNGSSGGWGKHFRSFMLSVPADVDLLDAANWARSNPVVRDASWLDGRFNGWLEGNAVVTPDGHVVNILRVDDPDARKGAQAAVISVSDDGHVQSFEPSTGFIDFPGANTKFEIRFDPVSRQYWALANYVPPRHDGTGNKGGLRNTLALTRSADLKHWEVRCIVAYHPDRLKHGFQYPAFHFDGEDIIVASRTAFDDGVGGAHSFHDANFLTFHRVPGFRTATMKDSCAAWFVPAVKCETDALVVEGDGFSVETLADGARAYANRDYTWQDVPARFNGWRFTRTYGGIAPAIRVTAKRDTTVVAATAMHQKGIDMAGWEPVPDCAFWYTDKGKSRMSVFTRALKTGESVQLPQGNWSGGIALIAPGESF